MSPQLEAAIPRIHSEWQPAQIERAQRLLRERGRAVEELLGTQDAGRAGAEEVASAAATLLMDEYRLRRESEVFEALVALMRQPMLRRVRSKLSFCRGNCDPEELLQDAFWNIFRYPDRFLANKPGAFAAWSNTIVDNIVRRSFRRVRADRFVALMPDEMLAQQASPAQSPYRAAADLEASRLLDEAYRVLLHAYWQAYSGLAPRERFVLEEAEVEGRRYAEIADALGIRADAVKMVVFRARKRLTARMQELLAPAASAAA